MDVESSRGRRAQEVRLPKGKKSEVAGKLHDDRIGISSVGRARKRRGEVGSWLDEGDEDANKDGEGLEVEV